MKSKSLSVGVALTLILAVTQVAEAKNGVFFKNSSLGAVSSPLTNILRRADLRQFDDQSASSNNLQYNGGPIMSKVKMVAVTWGAGVDPVTVSKIGPFFSAIANSTMMDMLTEYNTPTQTIGHGTFESLVQISPKNKSKSLSDSDIQKELTAQIASKALPATDADTMYMIYFPAGFRISLDGITSCQDFCAYHNNTSQNVIYGVMPDVNHDGCETGCGGNAEPFANTTGVTSHEFIEAVTDPLPSAQGAWQSPDGSEIGDLCVAQPTNLVAGNITYTIQQEYDNSISSCSPGPFATP